MRLNCNISKLAAAVVKSFLLAAQQRKRLPVLSKEREEGEGSTLSLEDLNRVIR